MPWGDNPKRERREARARARKEREWLGLTRQEYETLKLAELEKALIEHGTIKRPPAQATKEGRKP